MSLHVLVEVAFLSEVLIANLALKLFDVQMHLHMQVIVPSFEEDFSAIAERTFEFLRRGISLTFSLI